MKGGLVTLRADGAAKVAAGVTTIDEVLRQTQTDAFDNPTGGNAL